MMQLEIKQNWTRANLLSFTLLTKNIILLVCLLFDEFPTTESITVTSWRWFWKQALHLFCH